MCATDDIKGRASSHEVFCNMHWARILLTLLLSRRFEVCHRVCMHIFVRMCVRNIPFIIHTNRIMREVKGDAATKAPNLSKQRV